MRQKNKIESVKHFGRVAVLMGGNSCEREISLLSGANVLSSLQKSGVDAYALDVKDDVILQLQNNQPDLAFIALHGTGGEDGVIQSLLELLKIPYTCSEVAACALTMDKYHCNLFWDEIGLPVLSAAIVHNADELVEKAQQFSLPLCVKPVSSGSSCGISKVSKLGELQDAFALAQQYGSTVMLQPWVEGGVDFSVSILDNYVLPVIEIATPETEFYDYEAKYLKETTGYICPANLSAIETERLQQIALQAFNSTECRYFARVDFIRDQQNKFWILELNTIPGMTEHSLFPIATNKQSDLGFDQALLTILELALKDDKQ
ncbi:MAG: D-alanine--D-alanine ligase [Gammaproteobacteria bacterium]|nr:D-alanine--D-alanine ligase [Gammaproteobacteria bacterium]